MPKQILSIVIPGYNEETRIGKVVEGIFSNLKKDSHGFKINIIFVDDGSRDKSGEIASRAGAIVLTHPVNRGAGAATQTGLEKAKMLGSDFVVTIDADNQHDAGEIFQIAEPVISGKADIVIGSRFLSDNEAMPAFKKFGNNMLNVFVKLFYGWNGTDTMCGFRAFNKKALNLVTHKIDRYGFIAEVYGEAKRHKLVLKEVPIKTRYNEKKGTTFMDGLKIALENITRRA